MDTIDIVNQIKKKFYQTGSPVKIPLLKGCRVFDAQLREGLSLDSVEGHIAYTIYKKKHGDSIFRRITPIACILIWTGICCHKPGELILLNS